MPRAVVVLEPAATAVPEALAPPPAVTVPRRGRDTGAIAWETSEPDARARARREKRPLLVYARAAWDAAGLHMERTLWRDGQVAARASRFVALRLDLTEAEGDAELYARSYDVRVLPTTLLFEAGGRKVAAFEGLPELTALLEAMDRASE